MPFLVAAGPGTVWNALVVQATRDGEWWRLPLGFQGGDAKDFVTWLLPFAAIVTLAFAARRRTIGLFVLGVAPSSTTSRERIWSTRRGCWSSRPRPRR